MSRPEVDWLSSVRARMDRELLQPIVRAALGRDEVTVSAVDAAGIDYPMVDPDRRMLLRVSGAADDDAGTLAWSVVLKAFRRPTDADAPAVDDPTHYEYWEREPSFFGSGLWSDVGPGLRSVRCYGVQRWSPDEVWVWLEDVGTSAGDTWTDREFDHAAGDLGRFAGSFAAGRSLPTAPWLADTRSVQEQYSIAHPAIRATILPLLEAGRASSPVSDAAFGSARDRGTLREAFARQGPLLDALDGLPRTLCHNDSMAPNLFVRDADDVRTETIAIDWALAGIGPIGGDLGQLVPGSACFFRAAIDDLDALDQRTFESYLAGIEATGAMVDAQDVRFGTLATSLAQWTALVAFHLARALDPEHEAWVAEFWQRPPAEIIDRCTPVLAFLTRRAEETLQHPRAR